MSIDRRDFLKLSLASSSTFLFPGLSFAVGAQAKDPILVVVFLRGAMDGISFLPPVDDINYKILRPNIAITTPNPKDLLLKDGFGLHPALSQIRQIFNRGEASFLFEAGSNANTRSHFDAQDWMESGANRIGIETGFLGRASGKLISKNDSDLSVVAVQSGLPRILKGSRQGIAFTDFKSLKLQGPLTHEKLGDGETSDDKLDPALLKLYGESDDLLFKSAAHTFIAGSVALQRAEQIFENEKASLPRAVLAKNLGQISAMIRSQVGLKIAVTEMAGWDTHVYQGNAERGSLRDRLSDLDDSIASFWKSLADYHDQVCIVVMTEFGRTAQENGDRGTDHGHGSTFMVINGRLKSQKIYHDFKGLGHDQLHEGRDLQVKFDFRQIFLDVLRNHSKLNIDPKILFPEFVSGPELGIFRS